MKVILTERVSSLGNVGDILNVTAGYARNYLLPERKAVIADDANKAELENNKKALAGKILADKELAVELQKKINGLDIKFIKKVASNGKLFGSVTALDISKELLEQGFDVEKRAILLAAPIKGLGTSNAKVRLFQDVEAELTVTVSIDPKQVEEDKKRSEALEKEKELAAAQAKEMAENSDGEAVVDEKNLTDEQRLDKEARELLRS